MGALRELAAALKPKVFGNALLPAGLCVAGDRLSAVQLEPTPGGPALHAAATLELGRPWTEMLAEPRRFGQMLKRFWREEGFVRNDVVAAMPQEQLKVFTMEYSVAPGQADAEAIAAELRDRLKEKASALVVDFVPVRQPVLDERSKEAVIATAARADVIAFLELLGHGGLNVLALDIAGMALKRLVPWVQKGGGDTSNALLVNIGTTSTQLMIVSGRRLILERSIEFGEARLVARVATLLDLPESAARRLIAEHAYRHDDGPQAAHMDAALREILGAELVILKSEVAKTTEYTASKRRGAGIDRILVVGVLEVFPGIAQFLAKALGKPVELLDPLALFAHGLDTEEATRLAPHCGVAVAMGLALRGVSPS